MDVPNFQNSFRGTLGRRVFQTFDRVLDASMKGHAQTANATQALTKRRRIETKFCPNLVPKQIVTVLKCQPLSWPWSACPRSIWITPILPEMRRNWLMLDLSQPRIQHKMQWQDCKRSDANGNSPLGGSCPSDLDQRHQCKLEAKSVNQSCHFHRSTCSKKE